MSARTVSALCWAFAAIWALWALLRLTGAETGYPLVPLMAYTPYMAVAVLLPLALSLSLRRWAPAALAGAAGLYLALAVLPRALPDGEASQPLGGPTLNVLSANIFRGEGNLTELVNLVRDRDADLLCVQELTPEAAYRLRRLGLEEVLPHSELSVAPGSYGGGIWSRLPLRPLDSPPPSEFRMPRAAVRVPGFGPLRVVDVHPHPPIRGRVASWREGLESLPPAAANGPPWILAGDFNATLDHSELRDVLSSGYRDSADVRGEGLSMTWSARRSLPPPVAIDHVLVDERVSVLEFSREDLPLSDHHPVFAKLSLPRS
jgi:endonuclease/exonuclease/phosphatase family metal-dependent hydrolase